MSFNTNNNPVGADWISNGPHTPQIKEEPERVVSLGEYIDIVRRRRFTIGYVFVIIAVLGCAITLLTPPTYRSTAQLLVKAPDLKLNQIDASNPLSTLFSAAPTYKIETQVRLLQSEDVLAATAKKLGIRLSALPKINVKAIEDTEIIQVDAEDSDPKKATSVVNALLDTYNEQTKIINGQEVKSALKFTEEGANKAQRELEETEDKLRRFEQKYKVIEIDKNREAQIGEVQKLSDAYSDLQTKRASITSQLAALDRELASEPRTVSSVVSADSDSAVQTAQTQIANLEAQRAGLLKRYTPTSKAITALDAQLAVLRQHLAQQRSNVDVRNERKNPVYEELRQRRTLLAETMSATDAETAKTAEQLNSARRELANFPTWKQEMARLQRQLELAKSNYTLLSAKREDLRLRDQVQRADARVMEYAEVPTAPIRPKKALNITFALVLGFVLGLVIALIQEYLDDRINSQDEAERVLRLPTLGLIPLIPEEGLRLLQDTKSFSAFMEAYRSLRTNIGFAAVDNPIRTLMITSTSPSEGKSHVAANTAIAMAMDGRSVIIVDADLRRPTQHKLLKRDLHPGLTDVLLGTHALNDVLVETSIQGVRLITAGSSAPNPAELLSSEAMARVIDTLRSMADIVIVDTPPALAVADSVLLSSRMDGVLFVASHAETKRGSAQQAIQLLTRARANIIGTVLNKIDAANRGYYNYYHYEYGMSGGSVSEKKQTQAISQRAKDSVLTGESKD